jgi:alanyl-tRNA synthetase
MTRKLFWEDPYLTRLDTRITWVEDDEVGLESTIFFAFSGGQESDSGSLAGLPVLEARKDGLDIRYRLPPGHGLQPGQAVELLIDWPRRQRLMRLHFAAEMVLQLIYRLRPGIRRIGAHIAEDKARIDFAMDESIAALFAELEAASARLVAEDRPILCDYSDQPTQKRYWRVEGFASMACGGTHPRSTGEVGRLRLKRRNTGKGKERVEIFLID